jgi:voltage-gated potassium channel
MEEDEPRVAAWERRTDLPLTIVGLLYLVVYAVQVLAFRNGDPAWSALDVVLWATWALFVADFLGRLALARRRWRFVARHPFDVIVVLAPFFRFLRLLRLVTVVSSLARVLRDDFRGRVASYLITSVSLIGFVAALAV